MSNSKTKLIGMFVLFLAFSCGSDGDDGKDAQGFKTLFSRWVETDTSGPPDVIDFSKMSFGEIYPYNFTFTSGEVCSCSLFIQGTENSGEISLFSCFYAGGGNGDPNCYLFENEGRVYTYSKQNGPLEICSTPRDCSFYR